MPNITISGTDETCPGCHALNLSRRLEEWDPFPEGPVKLFERKECKCGYKFVLRDDLKMIVASYDFGGPATAGYSSQNIR
jgi:hypothetical protein